MVEAAASEARLEPTYGECNDHRLVEAAATREALAQSRPMVLVLRGHELVEAAGIEPFSPVNPNPMMANDFGFYCMKTLGLLR